MGVKLQQIITTKKIDFQRLAGKIIAVDAPNIIFSLFNFARKNTENAYNSLILDRTQRPISHLYGLLYRINFYYTKKIFPVFCFDGKVSELKRIITKDQLKDFLFTQDWYKQAIENGNKELARKIALSKEYLWQNIIQESKQLLGMLGIPYIESPSSAESQCAYLVKRHFAHFSNSQDYDSLLFGCPHIIQNLSKSMRRKVQGKWSYNRVEPILINLEKTLQQLQISIFQLIDMALMIGTDYFPGIKGIGPKKALHLIKKYKNIEHIIRQEKSSYDFDDLTHEIIKNVRKIFLLPDVIESIENIHWNYPNRSQVISLLCHEHNLNKERVVKNFDKFKTNYEKCRKYFMFQKRTPKKTQLTLY